MLRLPTRMPHSSAVVVIAALIAANIVAVAQKSAHERTASERAAVLADPLAAIAPSNHFGLEAPSASANHPASAEWTAACYRARAALIEQAQTALAANASRE